MGFLPYTCVCVRVKAENLCIFSERYAVKRQEMPNLPLFSVSGGFLLCLWTIYPPCQRKRLSGLKNGFCDF